MSVSALFRALPTICSHELWARKEQCFSAVIRLDLYRCCFYFILWFCWFILSVCKFYNLHPAHCMGQVAQGLRVVKNLATAGLVLKKTPVLKEKGVVKGSGNEVRIYLWVFSFLFIHFVVVVVVVVVLVVAVVAQCLCVCDSVLTNPHRLTWSRQSVL